MGGKSSKSPELSRSNTIRGSQRKIFQRVQRKYNQLARDLKSFQSDVNSPSHLKLKSAMMNIKFELEELKINLKDKHKNTHEEWTKKVQQLMEELDKKAEGFLGGPAKDEVKKNTESVEVTLEKLVKEKRNSQLSLKQDDLEVKASGPPNIEILRQEVLRLRKRILAFKGTRENSEYVEIKERLIGIFTDIDNVNLASYPQLRRERMLGLEDVQNCFKLLEEVCQDLDKKEASESSGDEYVNTNEQEDQYVEKKPTVVTSF